MAAYDYLKSERDSYSSKSVNVVDLMKKAKFEKKKEKIHTILVSMAALFVLVFISLIIISL